MKIVIAGGRNKADFLIRSLLEKDHTLIIINDEEAYCMYLSEKYTLPVIMGNPCKRYVLEEADIQDADVLIALCPHDSDNLAICQYAKKIFHVTKTVAIVTNPKNVDIFKRLGVSTAISATYSITRTIEQASTIESLVNTLSIDYERIVMNEIMLMHGCALIQKRIKEIHQLPKNTNICAVLRGVNMIIPNGDTQLLEHDKLLILSHVDVQDEIIALFSKGCALA